jgi:hypothetical protein
MDSIHHPKKKPMKPFLLFAFVSVLSLNAALSQIIINHSCTGLTQVPGEWITAAKEELHIAYGHTSHGSQVTDGMSGLATFTGGVGGPQFEWNNGGYDGALDLHDYAMGGDCGYYPEWVNNTRDYLDNPANADVNVIIWSWCGQISSYSEQDLIDKYINPMVQLETDYPEVKFVYMTGHLYYDLHENTTLRNQQLRDFCLQSNKILYDFADIESYDPDGVYYPYANDNCDYYENLDPGSYLGNWAINWQNTHTEGVDWYNCGSAHSQPLNANQKAYAAWHLWARLAGWDGVVGSPELPAETEVRIYPNPAADILMIETPGHNETLRFEIISPLGRRVMEDVVNGKKTIPLDGFAPGCYVIRLQGSMLQYRVVML